MFKLLRRKVYKPKQMASEMAVGKYIRKSDESLDTLTSSREEVMTPNTLDLMNGNRESSVEVTSGDSEGELVDDPGYDLVDQQQQQDGQKDDEDRDPALVSRDTDDGCRINNNQRSPASPYENGLQKLKGDSPLDDIIASLQNVGGLDPNDLDMNVYPDPIYSVVKKQKKKVMPPSASSAEKGATQLPKENKELTALIDSIVSEMDIFLSDGSDVSNEELKAYSSNGLAPLRERTEPVGSCAPNPQQIDNISNNKQPQLPPPNKAAKLKCESTPNLARKVKDLETELGSKQKGNSFSGYDSDTEVNDSKEFNDCQIQKKSVSFNDVVLEIERPRSLISDSSVGAADHVIDANVTEVKKKLSPLDQIIITTNIDSDSQCADEDTYRSSSVMSYDTNYGRLYSETDDSEVVAILTDKSRALSASDDVLSVAGEEDVYSSTEDTDGEKTEEEEYVPVKVRRHTKSRTSLLIVTWLILGMTATLPGTIFPYLLDQVNTTWEPLSRGLFAKGGGCLLGTVLAGIILGCCHGSTELMIIASLVLQSVALVTVPWFWHLLLFSGSCACEGLARGLLQISSHLFLVYIWKKDTGVKLVHGLYIAYAAGSALIPQITRPMIETSIADDIYHYMDKAGMDDILKINGYDIILNGTETVLKKQERQTQTQTYNESLSGVEKQLTTQERLYMIYLLLGTLPLICALIFFVFFSYTCVQTCKKNCRDYQHRRKVRRVSQLKQQIAQSRENMSSFQLLNGKPGENGTDTPTSRASNVGGGLMQRNGSQSGNRDSKQRQNGDIENGNNNHNDHITHGIEESPNMLTMDAARCNGVGPKDTDVVEVDHVTHVTASKRVSFKKLSFWERNKASVQKAKLRRKKEKTRRGEGWFVNERPCSTATLMYLYVFFSLPVAMEMVFTYFLYVYVMQSPLSFSELYASLLLSTFWGFMMLSRILVIPLAKICPPNAIVVGALVLNTLSSTVLALYGWRYNRIVWLFTALLGICLGPILPSGFTWANIYILHSAKSLALAYALAAVSMGLFSWIGGMVLQYYGYKSIMYIMIALSVLAFLLFLPAMRFVKPRKVFKFKEKQGKDTVYTTSQRTYV